VTERELDERLAFAMELARRAGTFALGYFRNLSALNIHSKGVQDMASQADLETEALVGQAIAEAYPDDDFLGEEGCEQFQARRGRGCWVVDPIDGTQPFISGIPSWCVAIAYVVNNQTLLAVVFDPTFDELFAARLGGGCTVNDAPCSATGIKTLAEALVGVGYSNRVSVEQTLAPLTRLLEEDGMFHRCGSGALSLAYVAAGRLAGYFEPHMNSWDSVAGLLLVSEAGGCCCDFFSTPNALAEGGMVLASGFELYPELERVMLGTK